MNLRTVLFWVAALCCVIAELAILRSVLFGRAATTSRSHDATSAPATRRADIAWALLPAAGLLLILYLTWRAVDPAPQPIRDVSHSGATIGG